MSHYSGKIQYQYSSIALPRDTAAASVGHSPAVCDHASSTTAACCTLSQSIDCYCSFHRTCLSHCSNHRRRSDLCSLLLSRDHSGCSCFGTFAPSSSPHRCSRHLLRLCRRSSSPAVAACCTGSIGSRRGATAMDCTGGGIGLFGPSRQTLAGSAGSLGRIAGTRFPAETTSCSFAG